MLKSSCAIPECPKGNSELLSPICRIEDSTIYSRASLRIKCKCATIAFRTEHPLRCSMQCPMVVIAGKLEAEIVQLKEGEREVFRQELGLKDSGLKRLIQVGYDVLGLVTFFTTVNQDLRAWTVPRGTPALQAAGKIHSDMERGFIKAEVLSFEDFTRCGSEHAAREKGLLKVEGKDYVVQDGDIIHFRFNV